MCLVGMCLQLEFFQSNPSTPCPHGACFDHTGSGLHSPFSEPAIGQGCGEAEANPR